MYYTEPRGVSQTGPERGGGGVSLIFLGHPESMCGGQAIEVGQKVGALKTDMQKINNKRSFGF